MASYPQFAVGSSSNIQSMIDSGVIRYPAYIFARDNHKYYFIDSDNTINAVVGDNASNNVTPISAEDIRRIFTKG